MSTGCGDSGPADSRTSGAADDRGAAPRSSFAPMLVLLLALLAWCGGASLCVGPQWYAPADVARAVLSWFGVTPAPMEPLPTIVAFRLWRVLTAAGVGAALAYSGGLLQGVFRNGLAAPSLLGVTSGASIGATAAILLVGGYGPLLAVDSVSAATLLVPVFAFLGALAAPLLVVLLAGRRGRLSTPTLLLFGVAVNICVGGVFAAVQSFTLRDWEVSREIMAWTFGRLDDRSAVHAAAVWIGVLLSATAIPRVATELDLFRGGESDAAALGVSVGRTKLVSLAAAALSAAAAVSVAGQIAFVGLVVPHVVRILAGPGHRRLLPLSLVGGALFLVATDLLQRAALRELALAPGVMMSLIGGPFFVFLLVRSRREVQAW